MGCFEVKQPVAYYFNHSSNCKDTFLTHIIVIDAGLYVHFIYSCWYFNHSSNYKDTFLTRIIIVDATVRDMETTNVKSFEN